MAQRNKLILSYYIKLWIHRRHLLVGLIYHWFWSFVANKRNMNYCPLTSSMEETVKPGFKDEEMVLGIKSWRGPTALKF